MSVGIYGQEYTCEHGEPLGDECPKCDPFNIDPDIEPHTDLGNARRLVAAHGRELRYAPPWRRWYVWDGRRWAPDITEQHHRWAKEIARQITNDAINMPDGDAKKAVLNAARRAESDPGVRGMLSLAGTEEGVVVDPASLDTDPDIINTRSGTLHLPSGELRPHDHRDNLTKITSVEYDPCAEAPRFHAFLEQVQPDADMRSFLQRLFGHALSGRIREHILPIFHGVGANGKSTLVEVCRKVLGDYAASVDPGLLIDRGETHPTGTADLFGLRLALTHESDQGRRLAEGTIKRLTGNDAIKARRMRENFWEFEPTHSLIMVTNHAPIVLGTEEGIWRRLRMIPFGVVIPPEARDPDLPEHLLKEGPGILRWMVEGYGRYRIEGLAAPEAVEKATTEYRDSSDMLGLFLAEKCTIAPNGYVASKLLFDAWVRWCDSENIKAGSNKSFSLALAERGFDKVKSHGSMIWKGIGLAAEDEE